MQRKERIENVKMALLAMQRFPWEQGVSSQAFLELGDHKLTFLLARDAVLRQSPKGRLGAAFYRDDIAIFGDDITVTDPATNGLAVQFIGEQKNDEYFLNAADRQVAWFLDHAPKTGSGVFCHVTNEKQVWVDSIFMAIPFLTIKGQYELASQQLKGYFDILWDPEAKLLSHIWDETTNDYACKDFWGVGNGWAAAGMAQIIRNLPESQKVFRDYTISLEGELLEGCMRHKTEENLFHNIVDDHSTFVETNLPQMIAYTLYSGVHDGWLDKKWISEANGIRESVYTKVDEYGLVKDVCSSPTFNEPGTAVEGQAFFLLMEAAAQRCGE